MNLQQLRALVDAQAEDEGLWFAAEHASEAYLQQELRRLHAAVEPMTDWQPISTAPRDREVILWRSAWTGPTQGRWIEPGDDWMGSTRGLRAGWYMAGYAGALGPVEPTHWQPLPDPPASTGAG